MEYNYDFEIASLVVLMIVLLHFLFVRQFPTDRTKMFFRLLLVCIGECVFNILSCIGIANAALVPESWNKLFAFAFFVLEGLCSYSIFRYVAEVCEFKKKGRLLAKAAGTLPFVFFEAMVLLTPRNGFFYYFDNGRYCQGFGAWYGYAYIVYYFLLNLALVLIRRREVNVRMKAAIFIYSATAAGAVVLQYRVRGLLLTSTANVIILLMLYFAMQNPSELSDHITGLANDKAFRQQLKSKIEKQERHAILTVYIRHFHHITSMLGVENGNQLLADVGSYLVKTCGKFHVFHNTEDTFLIPVDSEKESRELEEKIQKRFAAGWNVQKNNVMLDMALIIQHYPQDFASVSEFRNMWEYLLERAKKTGNQTVFETDARFLEKYRHRNSVELAVERAIRERGFEVYYQPIYSLAEKRIVSLEALVRLRDEELGYISPEEFIPLAEKNGTVLQIGEQVLEECCKFLSKHVLSNESLGLENIHVNVSAVQCLRQNLKETILPVLEKFHIPPSMISLEVTEGTAIRAPELMLRHMRELGKAGITFALDDYGSGNANCSYLIRFPFQKIKIDKEILWAYFEKKSARIVLQNEISTMKQLGLPVIVEGVENQEQRDEMERLGVDYIQGYYYGRPMPELECLRFIRRSQ